MIRPLPILAAMVGLAACTTTKPLTVSAINFLQEPIDVQCAYAAIRDADGFSVTDSINPRGTAQQISARFNRDMAIQILVRDLADGTAEVSAFVRLDDDASPLDRRAAEFAVRQADEAIYRSCTTDGQSYGGAPAVTLQPETNP